MSDSNTQTNLPLPIFYARTLTALLPLFDDSISPSESTYQQTLSKCIDELYLIARMITSLGVFSDNETIDELGDKELVFMTIGWVLGEAESKGGLKGPKDRKGALQRSDTAMNAFLTLLSSYKVLNPEEEAESSAMASGGNIPKDPARRREAKIRQYKREKELRERISTLVPDQPESSSSPIVFILSLLPKSDRPAIISTSTATTSSTSVNQDEPDSRDLTLLILRLLHTLALNSLGSTSMELQLLAEAPTDPSYSTNGEINEDERTGKKEEIDDTWKLDRIPGNYKPRELISGGGRVLRPFTILPSTTTLSDRERLRGEVFRSSHRLPTMTIDEYLEEEQRRGNIITGGGAASQNALTESELLALETQNDGTYAAEEADEKKRKKEENWATWIEANPRGAGNTLNRG